MKKRLPDYLPGIILFLIAVIIGMLTYQDYGISWDECIQRTTGLVTYDYVFHGSKSLLNYPDRQYGTGFELPLIIFEKALHLTDSRDVYLMRHMVTHVFFLVSALFAYVLIFRLYRNRMLACIGFIMLVTEPRIYAHSFFNTKDIPFLSFMLIALTVCQIAFEKNKTVLYFFLGLVCGYATGIRIMGVMLAGLTIGLLLLDLLFNITDRRRFQVAIVNLFAFPVGFLISLYVAWPYLWASPVTRFVESYSRMSNFNASDITTFFRGSFQSFRAMPLTYIAGWFSITTPELWLITGLVGMIWILVDFFKKPLLFIKNSRERNFLIYLACFFVPILMIVVMHSVIYDDWRHLYFIYPSFLMIAIYTFNKLLQNKYRVIVPLVVAMQLVIVAWFMIENHPFQQMYFNALVSHDREYLRKHYELDYWGACYKEGLDYLVGNNPSGIIKVSASLLRNGPLKNNINMLQEQDKNRIEIVPVEDADFYIANFRGHPEDYPFPKVEHAITVLNSTILCVYKIR